MFEALIKLIQKIKCKLKCCCMINSECTNNEDEDEEDK